MATVNYIPYKKQSAFTLRGVIQYACLKNKTLLPEGYRLITGQNCCAETAAAEFLSTKAQHKKTGDVQFYHYTQSFKVGENITPQTAHEIACEFARKNYPDYEVLIATHTDAPHIHSHFLIDYTQNQDPTLNYESKATYAAEFEGFRNMFLMLGGALSFIVGLVGILNFFNAILTGILTRRREFAMLQSIGMTGKQLKTMLVFEGLLYALGSIVLSLLLTVLAGPLLSRVLEGMFWFYSYRLTVTPILILLPVFVLLGTALPLLSYRGVAKQTIVERLREAE